MRQVEIIPEELKIETVKEFEKIKQQAIEAAKNVKHETLERTGVILEILQHDIDEIIEAQPHAALQDQVENIYKTCLKGIHSSQESAWLALMDNAKGHRLKLKRCFQFAWEVCKNDDPVLKEVYYGGKRFLKVNRKEVFEEIRRHCFQMRRDIMVMCQGAKKRLPS